ncbi:unnamed protein product [Didymodactylos carnosus]|uniref:AB hydrolase-1 domain-containing protein n=1 Tax=Didymodactylos carnosus TaxID=1234261 RepID=A0A814JKK9_9BILA|nr:unnamed protein product [Didymodactylos carnosus]CAF1039346.1 unnamed protein product [Didymodactylos carnosus]CAF3533480.1 unnamed protein product [Didymodactylos carnosus]CAF3809662.1 unnamed protein product [Didymodactylos carnosus]
MGCSLILVDLPGFGQSSGRDRIQSSWKQNGPEIYVAILSSFNISKPISVLAQCGGAATSIRTINRYPSWFQDRHHLINNSVTGDFGDTYPGEFEQKLLKYNIHLLVTWKADIDHPTFCIAYKRWDRNRRSGFKNLQLVDLPQIAYGTDWVKVNNIARLTSKNKAYFYVNTPEREQQIIHAICPNTKQ